ncbi:MAG: recombinase family protein, partial [Alphaproteobacteria bacterium]|nr:recombinase family protein [Alphaproteobacteria bacterium]
MLQQAIIYCRVSSPKQVTEGHGLASQETRCREYAKHKNYEVVAVFHEEGITGKLMDRPKMQDMLSFLKKHRKENHIIIIDDISRLARDIETHIYLRTAIDAAGGKLESPSIEFGEDSDSRLVEHLLASVAAHQREKNAEQVKNRMRARVMNGYWCFHPALGYRYATKAGHGKILVPNEPVSSIIKEALEGFASGRFETQTEVQRFFESQNEFPKDRKGCVHLQRIREILERSLYAGYIDVPKWNLSLQPGKHEPLISFKTYQDIRKRLQGTAKAP